MKKEREKTIESPALRRAKHSQEAPFPKPKRAILYLCSARLSKARVEEAIAEEKLMSNEGAGEKKSERDYSLRRLFLCFFASQAAPL